MSFLFLCVLLSYQERPFGTLDTGGPLSEAQAAIDSKQLTLALEIFPDTKTIAGYAETTFIVAPGLLHLELELVDSLKVSKVLINGEERPFNRKANLLNIGLAKSESTQLTAKIFYEGTPFEAQRPPWAGGFNWSKTDSGQPWIGVSCQGEGGKVWFPCKSHQVDKFEGVKLEITVPKPLYVAANGLLQKIEPVGEDKQTFHWYTKYPIASYNISVNIADYQVHERTYKGEKEMPVIFYALREYQQDDMGKKALTYQQKIDRLLDEALKYLNFYAKYFGEFPFIDEKFGLAHTHYLGMEHQTINSYGNHFKMRYGFDGLMLHEMGHEWFGNKVTVSDLADFWVQEGLTTYSTGMYIEEMSGLEEATNFFQRQHFVITNKQPIVKGKNISAAESYNRDIYAKGAVSIHALRYLIGKDAVYKTLHKLANDPEHTYLHGSSTERLIEIAEKVSGRELDWFFDVYIYRAAPPKLTVEEVDGQLRLSWDEPNFNMPLEIAVSGKEGEVLYERLLFNSGKAVWSIPKGVTYRIDPRSWVYKEIDKK